jgi:purine nucleosidase
MESLNTPYSKIISGILNFFKQVYKDIEGFNFPPIHDPTTIAYVVSPEIFAGDLHRVDVEIGSKFCDGRLVLDHKILWVKFFFMLLFAYTIFMNNTFNIARSYPN